MAYGERISTNEAAGLVARSQNIKGHTKEFGKTHRIIKITVLECSILFQTDT